ncbi:VOC family protein [Bacillus mycoides]|uniref:VOC family protein n=1 Tax=Bacillus cereus group TaxID=86661 RepID=UPI0001A09D01|nr:hypothetical protein [Bacillus mycoides]EEL50374.1 hypothetical protein bcere0022_22680 [Bacillus cereus Rock3-44]
MITHISNLELQTLSIEGVKQVYRDRLCLPIKKETQSFVQFQITPYTTISFREIFEPITPTHFAFQVPFSRFYESAKWIQESGLLIVKWEDGHEIDEEDGRLNLYFRDGDGNLLEIIAHKYVEEDVLVPHYPLNILYLREVGCPVENVPLFENWLKSNLRMKTLKDGEIFNFVIGGTAHIVANWWNRPWIPIAMKALPPKMHVSLGTPNLSFLQEIQSSLRQNNVQFHSNGNEISFIREGYSFSVHYTSNFKSDIPSKLKLPLSI